jgi:ribosomal subunit interface protein
MNIEICTRRITLTAAIRSHAERRFSTLDHFGRPDDRVSLILEHEHNHGGPEFLLKAHGHGNSGRIEVELRATDLYQGMDVLAHKYASCLRKEHERRQEHSVD